MNTDDSVFLSGVIVMIMIALLAVTLIKIAYGGHEECVVWNWGCKWVDNEVDCKKGDQPIRTDTIWMPVVAGKVTTIIPIVDEDYLYNCTKVFDNGTVLKYQEVE